jgi:hypothetical protein
VTRDLLLGKIAPPPGFDNTLAERLSQKRLDALPSGAECCAVSRIAIFLAGQRLESQSAVFF